MVSLEGTIDVHVHAGPELFRRVGDAIELATIARDAGMSGMVLKAHHEPTTTAAYYVAQAVPDFAVWGGVVLNEFVGGLNPSAVSSAVHQGGRLIWGPTLHSSHHIRNLGGKMFGVGHMSLDDSLTSNGLAWISDGESDPSLADDAEAILKIAAQAGVTVATGHASNTEVELLAEACHRLGARCLVTHGFFLGQDVDFLASVAERGAMIEVSASLSFPFEHYVFRNHGGGMKLEAVAELVERVGAEKIVISSDCGQLHNASPVEGLRSFLYGLKAVGVSEEDISTMTRVTPRLILGLETIDGRGSS